MSPGVVEPGTRDGSSRVVRIWRGWTEAERSAEYAAYMRETALPGYAGVPGNLGVLMLRRDLAERSWTEFTMVTVWDSIDDVRAFAGDDVGRAVFFPRDDELLVDRQWRVEHHEVYGATANPLGAAALDLWGQAEESRPA
jgi:heme-degrading monooxygenase HmoA